MRLVICECPKCITYTRINDRGESVNGQMVHISTRQKHWAHQDPDPETEEATVRAMFPKLFAKSSKNTTNKPEDDVESSSDESEQSETVSTYTIIHHIMYFLAWMYLLCGVSQANCRVARDYLVAIARMAMKARNEEDLDDEILNDVRSITKRLNLHPTTESYACCPKCYSLYDIEYGPPDCGYKERPTTKTCNAELFRSHKFRPLPVVGKISTQKLRQIPKPRLRRPNSVFVVQPMKDWLRWFLSLGEIETAIDDWAEKVRNFPANEVGDYQQSAAWRYLYPKRSTTTASQKGAPPALELAFSLFIDWFNPLGNKIAGRQVSIGIIALNCMNLPPAIRHQSQNTFLSGVVPAPGQPDMTTITHILAPLVDELKELGRGFAIPTHKYPKGRKVTVRLACLIGDIVATHKVAGFTSHSGTLFCTWCDCSKDERSDMFIGRLRVRREVLQAARHWKDCPTVVAREAARLRTGVRWSELNRLEYWDPVNSVGLGVMHNWLEGVLQHHFRTRWGFEVSKGGSDDNEAEINEDEIDAEVRGGWLSDSVIKNILKNLRDVVVPQGTTRIPTGLGTKANGKLKASEWHALFATHLPLAAIDVFVGNYDVFANGERGDFNNNLLKNFVALVECTHIIGATSSNASDSERFGRVYQEYTSSSAQISENINIVPNHHYALHTPSQMQWWGPMFSVAEFPGERLIGLLQKMNNNGKMDETATSLMIRFSQLQRLKRTCPPTEVNPKKADGGKFEVDDNCYIALLKYYQEKDAAWTDYRTLDLVEGAKILAPYATEVTTMEGMGGIRFNNGDGNKIVEYKVDGVRSWGIVTHCLKVEIDDKEVPDSLVCVRRMEVISNPVLDQVLRRIGVIHLKDLTVHVFIAAGQISATRAHRLLPAWSLGYGAPSMLVNIKENMVSEYPDPMLS